jgi:hypothetical protein
VAQADGGFFPSNSSNDEMTLKLIEATTRPCPNCKARHYHAAH